MSSEVFPNMKTMTLALPPGGQQLHPYKWQLQMGDIRGRKCRSLWCLPTFKQINFWKVVDNSYHRKNKMLYRCFGTGKLYFRRGLSERRLLLRLPRVQDTFLTIPLLSSHLNVLPAPAPLQHGPGAPTELLFIWHFDREVCASSWARFLQPLPKSCQRVWTRSRLQFLCGWWNHASQLIGRLLSCL